jgi:hypothetical protein
MMVYIRLFVGGNLVTWHNKTQSMVERSSAEAEFRAMACRVCEMLWLKILWNKLEYDSKDSMTVL